MFLRGVCLLAVALLTSSHVVPEHENKHQHAKRSSVCYGELGCFSNDAPFFSLQRPISLLPQSPDIIDPKFVLYTRQSPTQGRQLKAGDKVGLLASTFSASRPSKFIVHGWLDNGILGTWMVDMKNEFLKQGDYNVITVDWGQGSLSLYGQGTANTRVAGAMIAQLITFMQNVTGARPEDMHVLGHSLGSHVAGYAGERLKHLGRITGLDPAEPYFQNTDKRVRLDETDALFVDVIHTDASSFFSPSLGLGMSQACGHVDYYPNGGEKQPGCEKGPVTHIVENGLYLGFREFIACNHMRAYHLFHDSINGECPFQAYHCASQDDFKAGRCLPCSGQGCGLMGMHADEVKPPRGTVGVKYFFNTGDLPPYCRYHYKVVLSLSKTSTSKQERGKLYAKITGSSGQSEEIQLTSDNVYFDPGEIYTYVVTSKQRLGDVTNVAVRFDHDSELLNVFSWNVLGLRHPTLFVDRIQVFKADEANPVVFCGHNTGVETDVTSLFASKC